MPSRIPFRTFLTLATLTAACGETDRAPYVDDSYYADNAEASPGAGGGTQGGGSAWVGGNAFGTAADAGSAPGDAGAASGDGGAADVSLRSGSLFQNYLVDAAGRPLYLFANDVPGSNLSACTAACVEKWPVFDAKDIAVGTGLSAADFGRFQRPDGTWQTTFKGRPLYRFASDPAAGGVTGDGSGGRWFVARDYFAFAAFQDNLTPQGASAPSPYMTNRAGRTIYVFMSDAAAGAATPPVSACDGSCLQAWPTWNAPASLESLVLPSNMDAADFAVFERSVDATTIRQLTYRGWPLYFHTPDDAAGETSGHLKGAWRAIDAVNFAQGGGGSQYRMTSRPR